MWRREEEMRNAPRISVIIPVLQEEKMIAQTLALFTQELRSRFALEIIVSDGGSSDTSVELAKKVADVVVVHVSERRQTIAEGRNRGAEFARGDLLMFMNGDTFPAMPYVFFNFIDEWMNGHGKYAPYAALACPVEVIPSERKWSDVLFHTFFNTCLKLLSLLNIGVGRGECQIVRRDVFSDVRGYNAKLVAGEDFDFFARIAQHNSIAIANELLVYESPRRYRRFGYIPILWSWFLNWIGPKLLNRSISREWTVVR